MKLVPTSTVDLLGITLEEAGVVRDALGAHARALLGRPSDVAYRLLEALEDTLRGPAPTEAVAADDLPARLRATAGTFTDPALASVAAILREAADRIEGDA